MQGDRRGLAACRVVEGLGRASATLVQASGPTRQTQDVLDWARPVEWWLPLPSGPRNPKDETST